jgi:hypothetical protein
VNLRLDACFAQVPGCLDYSSSGSVTDVSLCTMLTCEVLYSRQRVEIRILGPVAGRLPASRISHSNAVLDGQPCGHQRRRAVEVHNLGLPDDGDCAKVHDLAISKYVSGREKDLRFTRELARHGLTDEKALLKRLAVTTVNTALREIVTGRIRGDLRARKASSS